MLCAPERRAREAETAPVKPAQLSVDHEFSGERPTARLANLLLPRPYDRLACTAKRTQRFALETVPAAVQVDATSVDNRINLEPVTAPGARLHV